MKNIKTALTTATGILLFFCLWLFLCPNAYSQKRQTAKEAYEVAKKSAKDWSGSATLCILTNSWGSYGDDGLSNRWQVIFRASDKKKVLEVEVCNGKVDGVSEENNQYYNCLSVESWMDSPTVLEYIKKYCNCPIKYYWACLEKDHWRVKVKCKSKRGAPLWMNINAKDGTLIKSWRGY